MKNPNTLASIARLLLTVCLCSFFALMLLLTQFNHPYADDYAIMGAVRYYGFSGYDKVIYHKWGGRFLSMFLGKIEAYHSFLQDHYWVHTTYLLLLNIISSVTLFSAINKYLIRFTEKTRLVVLAAMCYVALQITSLPEVWSAYYWFSSAVSYQPGIILLQFELTLLIIFYHTQKALVRWLCGSLILLLVVLINFSNELSILINGAVLAITLIIGSTKKHLPFIIFATLLYVGSAYIAITAPGNLLRSQNIPKAGVIKATTIATGRMLYVLWTILKNPFFLAGVAAVFFAGSYYRSTGSASNAKSSGYTTYSSYKLPGYVSRLKTLFGHYKYAVFLLCPFIIIFIFIPLMYVSNGSFPERANNEVVQFFIILLLCAAFITGSLFRFRIDFRKLTMPGTFVFAVTLCCNNFNGELIKSFISGKVHHIVMTQREQALKNAVETNQQSVTLLSYDKHVDSIVNTIFKDQREVIKILMRQKPSVLYSGDDLTDSNTLTHLKNYYKLPEIKVTR